jgi:guanosine-3',5'-bis(diphosphate) 3'-pyrophosphohydrolase
MNMKLQTLYQEAIKFATYKHLEMNQTVKGTKLPYVVHVSNVAMEIFMAALNTKNFDLEFAIPVALLHDTIEDTVTTLDELERHFGDRVAAGVLALTKNEDLPKEQQTIDSLKRIKELKREVWAVKLADRITNLQSPPDYWDNQKKYEYREESKLILHALRDGNEYLALRLKEKIEDYSAYIDAKS